MYSAGQGADFAGFVAATARNCYGGDCSRQGQNRREGRESASHGVSVQVGSNASRTMMGENPTGEKHDVLGRQGTAWDSLAQVRLAAVLAGSPMRIEDRFASGV